MTYVDQLKTSWLVVVGIRDMALIGNDFERVALFSAVAQDLATMIQTAGVELPSLDEVPR